MDDTESFERDMAALAEAYACGDIDSSVQLDSNSIQTAQANARLGNVGVTAPSHISKGVLAPKPKVAITDFTPRAAYNIKVSLSPSLSLSLSLSLSIYITIYLS